MTRQFALSCLVCAAIRRTHPRCFLQSASGARCFLQSASGEVVNGDVLRACAPANVTIIILIRFSIQATFITRTQVKSKVKFKVRVWVQVRVRVKVGLRLGFTVGLRSICGLWTGFEPGLGWKLIVK